MFFSLILCNNHNFTTRKEKRIKEKCFDIKITVFFPPNLPQENIKFSELTQVNNYGTESFEGANYTQKKQMTNFCLRT